MCKEQTKQKPDAVGVAVEPEVRCAPEIFEMALYYSKRERRFDEKWIDYNHSQFLEAIKMVADCQNAHYGDECILCMST